MQAFPVGVRATLVAAAAALMAVWVPGSAWGQSAAADLRVTGVEVSDGGVVSATVVSSHIRTADPNATPAFEVREEGEKRDVDTVAVAARDVAVALVVDTSAEQPVEQFREVQNIVMELALRLPPESPVALVAMGGQIVMAQDGTTDVLERAAAAGRLELGGRRWVNDAVALAVEELMALPATRRSVVVVGSGDDQGSSATQADVLEQLRVADTVLYVIDPSADEAAPKGLGQIAPATGGLVLVGEDYRDPFAATAVVLAELLHQYSLTFQAEGRGDTTVNIRLATEAVNAETTVNVSLPTAEAPFQSREERAEGDTGAPAGSPMEDVPRGGWLIAAAAVGAATLAVAGIALLVTRAAAAGPALLSKTGAAARTTGSGVATAAAGLRHAVGRAGTALAGAATPAKSLSPTVVTRVRRRKPSREEPSWQEVAAQIHREVGGDSEALLQAAARIEATRHTTAEQMRAAALDGRLAVITLTPLPVVIGVFRHVLDASYLERVTSHPLGWLSLVIAGALTSAGAIWLWRVARPPFAAFPASWRLHRERAERWQQTADALDRAWLYVLAGLDLELALKRALPDERRYEPLLRKTLTSAQSGGAPVDVLAATRTRLYADWQAATDAQAERLPVATVVPFAICIVPAMVLVGLADLW